MVVNFLSAGIIARVVAIVAVCYYLTYLLTLAATLYADSRGRVPTAPEGTIDIGRWLKPLAWLGIAWALVIIALMTLPHVNHVAGEYTLYALAIGAAWWIVYLRRKIAAREAGAHTEPAAADPATEQAIAVESVRPVGLPT
jgi:type II secretory pathway component PulF